MVGADNFLNGLKSFFYQEWDLVLEEAAMVREEEVTRANLLLRETRAGGRSITAGYI